MSEATGAQKEHVAGGKTGAASGNTHAAADIAADDEYVVESPLLRSFVAEVRRVMAAEPDRARTVAALRPAFGALLADRSWLPDALQQPDQSSGMGAGISQYLVYRSATHDLTLSSLVLSAGTMTPVHDHLAWGLVGVYRGTQDEIVYRRLDDGRDPARADLEVAKRQTLERGEFYPLLPPLDDIHYVKTTSDTPSISIHLLANDTACVWRHRFEPASGLVTPFRSGYANAPCPEEAGATPK